MSSAFDFLVETLQHVGRFEMLVVLTRQPVKEMLWGERRGQGMIVAGNNRQDMPHATAK
jgi:hypothetical protein